MFCSDRISHGKVGAASEHPCPRQPPWCALRLLYQTAQMNLGRGSRPPPRPPEGGLSTVGSDQGLCVCAPHLLHTPRAPVSTAKDGSAFLCLWHRVQTPEGAAQSPLVFSGSFSAAHVSPQPRCPPLCTRTICDPVHLPTL